MCDAIGIITGIGGAVSFASQTSSANSLEAHQKSISARNVANANIAARNSYYQSQAGELQQAAGAAQDITERSREAVLARSTVVASAANAGVSGNSVEAILDDFSAQEGRYNAAVRLNQIYAEEQGRADRESIRLGHDGRLVSAAPDPVQKPNFATAAFSTFTSVYNASPKLQAALR